MKVAIIPARGGSKRIPLKNIRPFAGKPIIAYSIDVAKQSGLFDRIIVSTDNQQIAEVGRNWGAEVPFMRPAALADDHTGTIAVIKHALRWLQESGQTVAFACCIYPTAPFLQVDSLKRGLELLSGSTKSFAFPVTTFGFPIQRSLRLREDGSVEALWPEHANTRSQDLAAAFHDAGQFCWGRPEGFLEDVPVYSPAALAIVIPRHLVQDIDTPEDWQRAELMYRVLRAAP